MFRQTPSGPTFTQTPLLCVPEDEPDPGESSFEPWYRTLIMARLADACHRCTTFKRNGTGKCTPPH
jgi:hypothetical protein